MKQINKFNTDTKIHFSELPMMKPVGQNPTGHSVWEFCESMTIHWIEKHKKYTLRIPANFLTDFSSTPKWVWWWLPPFDIRYTPACLPHDLGYERNGFLTLWVDDNRTGLRGPMETKWSRLAVDQLMLAGMKSRNVSRIKSSAIYRAVRIGGLSAWNKSRNEHHTDVTTRRVNLGYTNGVCD